MVDSPHIALRVGENFSSVQTLMIKCVVYFSLIAEITDVVHHHKTVHKLTTISIVNPLTGQTRLTRLWTTINCCQ